MAEKLRVVLNPEVQKNIFYTYRISYGGSCLAAATTLGLDPYNFRELERNLIRSVRKDVFDKMLERLRQLKEEFQAEHPFYIGGEEDKKNILDAYSGILGGRMNVYGALDVGKTERCRGFYEISLDEDRKSQIERSLREFDFSCGVDIYNPETFARTTTLGEVVSAPLNKWRRSVGKKHVMVVYKRNLKKARKRGAEKYGSMEKFLSVARGRSRKVLREKYGEDYESLIRNLGQLRATVVDIKSMEEGGVICMLETVRDHSYGPSMIKRTMERTMGYNPDQTRVKVRDVLRAHLARRKDNRLRITPRGELLLKTYYRLKERGAL